MRKAKHNKNMVKRGNDTPKLDLHNVRHSDVEAKVERFVLLGTPPMDIVTGNSSMMKDIVKGILDEHRYKYRIGDHKNPGYIRILS